MNDLVDLAKLEEMSQEDFIEDLLLTMAALGGFYMDKEDPPTDYINFKLIGAGTGYRYLISVEREELEERKKDE